MNGVVDIACPACRETTNVWKVALGEYRCAACGREFTSEDVLPG